jgi:hypothetical protein
MCFCNQSISGRSVGQTAHQRHRAMGVQVDQAGDQDVLFQADPAFGAVAGAGLGGRQHVDDASVMHGDGMVAEQGVGIDRGDPAGFDQQVDGDGCRWHGKVRLCGGCGVVK